MKKKKQGLGCFHLHDSAENQFLKEIRRRIWTSPSSFIIEV